MSQSFALLLLGAIMAIIVGWLLTHTMNVRPWLAQAAQDGHRHEEASLPAAKIGLWVFLVVVTSLFALFISAYTMRMELGDWQPVPEPGLLWLNTAVLILTSVAMQWTRLAVNRADARGVRIGLIAGGVLTFAFLAGQLAVWQQLNATGYLVAGNPANAFFYLLTALHAVHLLGGLVVWGRTAARMWHGVALGELRLSVELCTVYWHYLLLVWLVLFALLLST